MNSNNQESKMVGVSQYLMIAETIKSWITSGRYKSGDTIATVGELAKQFGVARGTIQEAMKELSRQEVIVTSRGKRSTVRKTPQIRPVFSKMDSGDVIFVDQVGENQGELLSVQSASPEGGLLASFDFCSSEPMVEFRSLAFLNSIPNAYILTYLPEGKHCVSTNMNEKDFQELFKSILDGAMHQERRVSAMSADFDIANNLKIAIGTPILHYKCLIWRKKRELEIYYEAFLRTDNCEYRLDA